MIDVAETFEVFTREVGSIGSIGSTGFSPSAVNVFVAVAVFPLLSLITHLSSCLAAVLEAHV